MARAHLRHIVTDRGGNVIQNASVNVSPAGGFDPNTAPVDPSTLDLISWFDFSDATKLYTDTSLSTLVSADAQEIKGAKDKSGNNRHVTLPATLPLMMDPITGPIYKTNIQNGKSVARLAGASALNQAAHAVCTQPNTVFAVGSQSAGFGYFFDGVEDLFRTHIAGDNVGGMFLGADDLAVGNWNVNAHTGVSSTMHIWTGQVDSANSTLWMDGAVAGGGDAGANNFKGITIGSRFDGDPRGFGIGDFCEIIIVNGNLSDGQRNGILAYLFAKWGITIPDQSASLATMYPDATGDTTITSPLTTSSTGEIEAFFDSPQQLNLQVTDNTDTAYYPTATTQPISFTTFSEKISTEPVAPHDMGGGAVRFVTLDGNNDNDGLSWESGKSDIVGAFDSTSSPVTIFFESGVSIDDSDAEQGLWIMGAGDPEYNGGDLPDGWRPTKQTHLVGVGKGAATFGRKPRAVLHGGSTNDRDHPAIWTGAFTSPGLTLENVVLDTQVCPVRLGVSLDGTTIGDSANYQFTNCKFEASATNISGPVIDIGYVFWAQMKDSFLQANTFGWTISAASITAGTTARFTVSSAHDLSVGDTVHVTGMNLTAYNSESSAGTDAKTRPNPKRQWRVTNVSDTTHFDVDIGASPAAATIGGTERMFPLQSHRRQVIAFKHSLYDPSSSPGIWQIDNTVFGCGGMCMHIEANASGGVFTLREVVGENGTGTTNLTPPLFHLRLDEDVVKVNTAASGYRFDQCFIADGNAPGGAVLVDGEHTDPGIITGINTEVRGNATIINPFVNGIGDNGLYHRNQSGLRNGLVLGKHDGARRHFPPTAVPFVNLAPQNPAAWGSPSSTGVLTAGQRAPDGTLFAAKLEGGLSGGISTVVSTAKTYGVGDWLLAGVWCKFTGVTTGLGSVDPGSSVTTSAGGSGLSLNQPTQWADGGWEWVSTYARVTVSSGAKTLVMNLGANADQTVYYYAPMLVHIPVADAPPLDEVVEMWRHMGSWPETASKGDLAIARGQNLHIPLSYIDIGVITAPSAPASNFGRLYVDTNGGKDRLVVIFASGAAQVLATEP